jgi:hypothetical protein
MDIDNNRKTINWFYIKRIIQKYNKYNKYNNSLIHYPPIITL